MRIEGTPDELAAFVERLLMGANDDAVTDDDCISMEFVEPADEADGEILSELMGFTRKRTHDVN